MLIWWCTVFFQKPIFFVNCTIKWLCNQKWHTDVFKCDIDLRAWNPEYFILLGYDAVWLRNQIATFLLGHLDRWRRNCLTTECQDAFSQCCSVISQKNRVLRYTTAKPSNFGTKPLYHDTVLHPEVSLSCVVYLITVIGPPLLCSSLNCGHLGEDVLVSKI